MLTGSALKNLKMKISKEGSIVISYQNHPYQKLSDFEKYFYPEDKNVGFINSFLFNEISIENNVTILDILNSFIPWKEQIEKIIDINIDSYIDYINNYVCNEKDYSKWEKIEFIKRASIKKINKCLFSIEEIVNQKLDINKCRQFTGYFGLKEGNINLIYFYDKDNQLSHFSGDPLIDVSTYKNVPIILNENGVIESVVFSENLEGALIENDDYGKKTVKLKMKNNFYFIDLLVHLSSLLYFYEPLNSEQKSENYKRFSDNFSKLSESNNSEFKTESTLIWEDFVNSIQC